MPTELLIYVSDRPAKPLVKVLSTGFEPLYKIRWQDAIKDLYSGRFEVVEHDPDISIGTSSGQEPFPAVVRFARGVFLGALTFKPKQLRPTRRNIYERDSATCQYCASRISFSRATMDHVVPKSRGGKNTWSNLVLSCATCNNKKGNRTPGEANMKLLNKKGYSSPEF